MEIQNHPISKEVQFAVGYDASPLFRKVEYFKTVNFENQNEHPSATKIAKE